MKTEKNREIMFWRSSPEKIMKNFYFKKNMEENEHNEENDNQIINEIEISLKKNFISVMLLKFIQIFLKGRLFQA